jgi:glutaredoxin 3
MRGGNRENVISSDASKTDANFLIYSTDHCPYCVAAKRYLQGHGFDFTEIDLSQDFEKRDQIVKESGHRTVPVIFDLRNGKPQFIGGFDDLQASGIV